MTRYLIASRSVHTTAAACDYLQRRVGADDTVVVVTVSEPDLPDRDAGDAGNVARTRLLPATVETETREGDPGEALLAAVEDHDADVLLLGPHRGDPDADADLGETARTVLSAATVPVVVVPLPDL
jgi:nucleotide-binding universal stress UspA family protein